LLHGNHAHADWWGFIAPFLADESRIAAISWSGMGRSDWRDRYSIGDFMAEALTCAEAAGIFEHPAALVVAHSFGARAALRLAAAHGEKLRRLVLVDAGLYLPGKSVQRPELHPTRSYPSLAAALARFRLRPFQTCGNHYILDHVARHGLKRVSGANKGWTWRFDPKLWSTMPVSDLQRSSDELSRAKCGLTFIMGEKSGRLDSEAMSHTRRLVPEGTRFFGIPEAGHHVWLDQPLAFVASLRAIRSELVAGVAAGESSGPQLGSGVRRPVQTGRTIKRASTW
jgi:pimeloyl-ACP methyl ester carboxylesterase